MQLTSIALNNLVRRKNKTIFILAGIIIGIAAITALYSITTAMQTDISNKFDQIGANILITPQSNSRALSYEGVAASGSAEAGKIASTAITQIQQIKNRENISIIAPKLIGNVSLADKPALVIGVDFPKELVLRKWWQLNATPDTSKIMDKPWQNLKLGNSEIILGALLAQRLNKQPGEQVQVNGVDFKIAAVLRPTGDQEDQAILMDITKTQQLLKRPREYSMIEVAALCNTCPINEIVSQISRQLSGAEVKAVKQAVEARKEVVERFSGFALATSLIILFIGLLTVFITIMASVNERKREIGIFRAIGFKKLHIARVIFTEALITSAIGGILGYLIGFLAAKGVAPLIAQMDLVVQWSWLNLGTAVLVAIAVGLLASLFPVWTATRLDPVEALRFI